MIVVVIFFDLDLYLKYFFKREIIDIIVNKFVFYFENCMFDNNCIDILFFILN